MRKQLLASTTALFLLGAFSAHATTIAEAAAATPAVAAPDVSEPEDPRNLPFLEGDETPSQIADMLDVYLRKHPTGDALIVPAKCTTKVKLACTNGIRLLAAIKDVDRNETHLNTVSDLPAYLRKLQRNDNPPLGHYQMYCQRAEGSDYKIVSACVTRTFHKGEPAWENPDTRVIVLAGHCKNPVNGAVVEELQVKLECPEIDFTAPAHSTVFRYEIVGDHRLKLMDGCPLGIQLQGEQRKEFSDDCASKNCTFREAESAAISAISRGTIITVTNIEVRSVRGSTELKDSDQDQIVKISGPPDLKLQVTIACVDAKNDADGTPRYSNGKGVVSWSARVITVPAFVFPGENPVQ